MTYDNRDVDNADLQQLHSYSYYFYLKEEDKFKGAELIYPTKKDRDYKDNNIDNIFGLKNSKQKFGIFSIKDPSKNESMNDNEIKFINELKSFLESK